MTEDIQRGHEIAVERDGDVVLTGTVETIHTEWGRKGYTVITDDGAETTVWQEHGIEIRRARPVPEKAREARKRLQRLEENVGHAVGIQSARDIQAIRESLREIEQRAIA